MFCPRTMILLKYRKSQVGHLSQQQQLTWNTKQILKKNKRGLVEPSLENKPQHQLHEVLVKILYSMIV